jgi:vancomycin resistance protein YoaR
MGGGSGASLVRIPSARRIAAVAALVALVAGVLFVGRRRFVPIGSLPGLRIDGAVVPLGADLHAFVTARSQTLRAREVQLAIQGDASAWGRLPLGELGVTVDVESVVARARMLLEEGDLLERWDLRRRAARGQIDVPLDVAVDPAALGPLLDHLKDVQDRAPVSARLDLEHRAVVSEVEGRYIDPFGAADAVLRTAEDPARVEVVFPIQRFPARHSRALLSQIDVNLVLGTWDTYFSRRGDQERRGRNIDVAAEKIDGLVMLPGELVSFNDVVGERSEENGFERSWEIYKGEMVEGVGGGTCQVASTFHAAVFFGGLDVIERLPHSRPSAYIPMGLDATVVYPVVDLKVRNPYPFPIVMHAKVDGNRLRMTLLGPAKPARVSFARELLETYPYKRKVEEEPKLSWSKRVVLKQHGIRGYKIRRVRTLRFADGRSRREANVDMYPSTTEIYEVPPGFDTSVLPPLPDEDEDAGEGSDTSAATASAAAIAGAAVAPTPLTPPTPASSSSSPTSITLVDGTTLSVQEGKGAHAPTQAQADPPKKLTLTR